MLAAATGHEVGLKQLIFNIFKYDQEDEPVVIGHAILVNGANQATYPPHTPKCGH